METSTESILKPGAEGLPAAAFRADPGPLLSPRIQGVTDPTGEVVCVGFPLDTLLITGFFVDLPICSSF